ncbi:MAG: LamB/YcsF family protein [Micromonosporaceae bacterium]|nr:LamB/YcsF family protein [Micromonosporaceae bacterium]
MDLNCDLGEGFGVWRLGDDEALLDLVTSANVACGFHGGDPLTMRRVCERAVERGVAIGAQVGYRDLAGFGRRYIDMPAAELTAEVIYQIGALDAFCRVAGDRVRYVKPHGALYHAAASDPVQAAAVVAAVRAYDPGLPVLCLPGTELAGELAAAGLAAVPEAFADRAYRCDGGLVARGEPGAVLHEVAEVAARCVRLAREHTVASVDGTPVAVRARSICVHGDTPGAVEMARAVRAGLDAAGVRVARFG